MRPLIRSVSALAAASALLVTGLVVAAPAHAATALEQLQAKIGASAAVFPQRAQVRQQMLDGGVSLNIDLRLDQPSGKYSARIFSDVAGSTYQEQVQGYTGTRAYQSLPAGTLNSAQIRALKLAGYRAPFLVRTTAGPDTTVAGFVADSTPIALATAAAATAAPGDVIALARPGGATFFRVAGTTQVDVLVDAKGVFTKVWEVTATGDQTVTTLLAKGAGVDVSAPKGYSTITEEILAAAVAAYPKNLATAQVNAKATAIAKKVNKWSAKAKKKAKTAEAKQKAKVSAKVIAKRGSKPIAGYTVVKTAKGVKLTRTYPPAGSVSRCVIAKHGKAKVRSC
jgi:hypothetical protein